VIMDVWIHRSNTLVIMDVWIHRSSTLVIMDVWTGYILEVMEIRIEL